MTVVRSDVRKLTSFFAGRFPDTQDILGVYAVIVTLVYTWTMLTSFYKVPSWLFYLTIGQILSVYAYSFLLNLVESLLILAVVLFLEYTIFLPLRNREEFQSRSILIVFALLISSMTRLLLYKSFEASQTFVQGELAWWLVTLVVGLFLAIFVPKVKKLRNFIEAIAERTLVFLYVYLPLSLIAIIVVIARNIN